jgi:hypothetical protein
MFSLFWYSFCSTLKDSKCKFPHLKHVFGSQSLKSIMPSKSIMPAEIERERERDLMTNIPSTNIK